MKTSGKIIVISGPTGSGESAVTQAILKSFPGMQRIITVTSRPPRPYEAEGRDYHFVTPAEFKTLIKNKELFEYIKIPNRNVYYGTMKKNIEESLGQGINMIGNLGWPGHAAFERYYPGQVLSIFLKPDNLKVLAQRLIHRDPTISKEEVEKRLANAKREMKDARHYDHVVSNPDGKMNQAVREIKVLVSRFLKKGRR